MDVTVHTHRVVVQVSSVGEQIGRGASSTRVSIKH